MAKILRMKDRVSIKIGSVTFTLAPLNKMHKVGLTQCTRIVKGEETYDLLGAQCYYLKHSLKDVKGLKTYDNEDYELEFEGDCLTDDCVSEILNIGQYSKLTIAAWQILDGIAELKDPITGEKLEGVTLKVIPGGK